MSETIPPDEPTHEESTDPENPEPPPPGDPRLEDQWREVGDDAKRLGETFRRHYAGEDGPGPGDDLKDAARSLGRGLERFFGALGDTIKDPEMKEQARRTGSSFLGALSSTFSQVGEDIGDAFDGSRRDRGEEAPASSEASDLEAATRELDDADLLDELKSDLAEDESD